MAPATPRPVALGAIPWEGVWDGPLPEPEVSLPPLPLPSVEDGLEPPSVEDGEAVSEGEPDSEPEPVEEAVSEPDWEPETSV